MAHQAYTLTAEAAERDDVRLEYRMYKVMDRIREVRRATAARLRAHPQISGVFANKATRMILSWKGPRHPLGHEAREERIQRHVRSWEYLIAHSKATEGPAAIFRSNISEWQNGAEDSPNEGGGGSWPKESKDTEDLGGIKDLVKRTPGPEAPEESGEQAQLVLREATGKVQREEKGPSAQAGDPAPDRRKETRGGYTKFGGKKGHNRTGCLSCLLMLWLSWLLRAAGALDASREPSREGGGKEVGPERYGN